MAELSVQELMGFFGPVAVAVVIGFGLGRLGSILEFILVLTKRKKPQDISHLITNREFEALQEQNREEHGKLDKHVLRLSGEVRELTGRIAALEALLKKA